MKPYSLGTNLFVLLERSAACIRLICPLLVASDSMLMAEMTVSMLFCSNALIVASISS